MNRLSRFIASFSSRPCPDCAGEGERMVAYGSEVKPSVYAFSCPCLFCRGTGQLAKEANGG